MKQIMKRVSMFLMLTVFVGILTGCSSIVSKQSNAIKEALAIYTEPSENGFRIWYDKSDNEIKTQQEEQKLEEEATEATYQITIRVPNVGAVDLSNLTYDIPEYNLEKPDSKAFRETYQAAFSEAFIAYMKSKEDIPTTDVKITVTLTKEEKDWIAALDEEEMNNLAALQQSTMDQRVDDILSKSEDYAKILLAEDLSTYLTPILASEQYMDHIKLTNIETTESGDYKVSITYPNPINVYKAAGEAYFETLDIVYGKKTQKFILKKVNAYLDAAAKAETEQVTSTFTIKDGEAGIDIEDIKTSMASAQNSAAKELTTRINEKAIAEQKRPATGVLKGTSKGRTIKIEIPKKEGNFYLKFYKVSDKNTDEEGTLVLTVFIRQGDTATIKLPNGTYKMKESVGTKWYGQKHAFGSAGSYATAKSIFKIESNYAYTLKLRNTTSGNVPTENIDYNAF